MIEIKDIAGLSQPIKKLIEVVAEGIGGVSRPLLTRKNADAKAYEIRTITQAIAHSQKLLGQITYDDGSILIDSSTDIDKPVLPEATVDQRITARIAYQQFKKQNNIEQITRYAAEELYDEKEIKSENPDSDWTTRFFRIAEDITNDQMQILWGKVLAGEVKRPGSYSLRTLDVLKNITQQEAELFVRVGHISFVSAAKVFVPDTDQGNYLKERFALHFTDFLLLRQIGLLAESNLEFFFNLADHDMQHPLACGSTCIVIKRPKGTPRQGVQVILFTEIGRELLQLIERKPADPDYIKRFVSFFRREGISTQSGIITAWKDDGTVSANLTDIPA